MNLLNIVKKAADMIASAEINSIVGKVNELVEWVNTYEASHGSATSIQLATVVGIQSKYTYTGENIVPEFRVYMGGQLLIEGTDYDYQLDNNKEIGTGKVTIYGIGKYTSSKQLTFAIEGVKYNLTYNENGHGSAPSSKKVSVIEASDIALLTAEGYTCTGWYTEATGGTKITAGYTLTKDTTIYAHWEASTFNLTYEKNGHGSVTQPTAKYATLPTLPTLSEDGQWFIGWFYDQAFTQKASAGDALTKNTTLYAKWVACGVTAKLAISGEAGAKTYSYTIAKDSTTAAVLSVDTGTGYETVESGTKTINLTAASTIKYKITYSEGGVNFSQETSNLGLEINADDEKIKFMAVGTGTFTLKKNGTETTTYEYAISSLADEDEFLLTHESGNTASVIIDLTTE